MTATEQLVPALIAILIILIRSYDEYQRKTERGEKDELIEEISRIVRLKSIEAEVEMRTQDVTSMVLFDTLPEEQKDYVIRYWQLYDYFKEKGL